MYQAASIHIGKKADICSVYGGPGGGGEWVEQMGGGHTGQGGGQTGQGGEED